MSVKTRNRMRKLRDSALATILDHEQLAQYYRGVYDAEANAEGISIADRLQKTLNIIMKPGKKFNFLLCGVNALAMTSMYASYLTYAHRLITVIFKRLRHRYYVGVIFAE